MFGGTSETGRFFLDSFSITILGDSNAEDQGIDSVGELFLGLEAL
jgi:hypothetical protein